MDKGKQKKNSISAGRTGLRIGSIIAALIAAIALFFTMLQMEKNMLDGYERQRILIATRQIPKGQLITERNASEYMEVREVSVECVPENVLTDPKQMEGKIAVFGIAGGVPLAEGMFEDVNEITKAMKAPTIAGCKAEDLYQIVGGVLRSGDRIHIYAVSEEGEAHLIWQNVFVQQVFDNSGTSIPNEDQDTSAQRINVYLEKEDVERFYSELAEGALRVVKVCR